MAAITIKDLHRNDLLDRGAMSSIQGGGGAPWVYGWIRPFTPHTQNLGPVVNFYQINNYADQIINQYQNVEVSNTGTNSNINLAVNENSANTKIIG
jgi:hypothetical protein